MPGIMNFDNNNGKVVTLQHSDTNTVNKTVYLDKVVTTDDNGNIGIGTTVTPIGNFKVIQLDGASGSILSLKNNGTLISNTYVDSTGLNVTTQTATPIIFQTNATEKMRIDSKGNIGVGVVPSAWIGNKALQIGMIGIQNDIGTNVGSFMNNTYYDGANHRYIQSLTATRYSQYNGTHEWKTAPSGTAGNAITWNTAMTLNTAGKLNIEGSAPCININENYTGTQSYVQCYVTSSSNNTFIAAHSTTNGTGTPINVMTGGVNRFRVWDNGNVQSATNSYGSTSDAKLKENIVDTTPKLEKLLQVQVRNFNYIGQDEKQIGVIAQEIEQIFPGVVFETKDTKQVEVEKEDGSKEFQTVETGETTKNVKYSVIYMMMLKAMQEQQEIINDLKTRLEILEGGK